MYNNIYEKFIASRPSETGRDERLPFLSSKEDKGGDFAKEKNNVAV
jgi:hypothetical protein